MPAWDMPVTVRKWWINRTSKELEARAASRSKEDDSRPKGPPPWSRGVQK